MNTDLLNKTLIGRDFLRLKDKTQPSVDVFLDWRNQLTYLKTLKKYPAEWYQLEIESTDEILKYLNGETVKLREVCLNHINGRCSKPPSPDNCDNCDNYK